MNKIPKIKYASEAQYENKSKFFIDSIKAREILDSRGSWTVEIDLETPQGLFRNSASSGASTGKYEAPVVSPREAVKGINEIIAPKLKGEDFIDQQEIDKFLDPEKFGANATTPISMALCRAGAAVHKIPLWKYVNKISEGLSVNLPSPAFNMINGGVHASNKLDFQEFMVICNTQKASEIYQDLRKKLGKNVGDEGGFAPSFRSPEEALDLLSKYNVKIIIDVAASQFSEEKKQIYNLDYFQNLVVKYPIIGLEDPFAEDDWSDFRQITEKLGKKITIIGDDLLVTNPEKIKRAHQEEACNGLLLKINQIGTVAKTLEAAKLARSFGWKIMVSHRSGETNDDFIADFAVGIGADFIKSGAPARGERVAKYNRLLRIAEELK
ncbi:MAG TPA: enolase [Candidatus Humimicrobiaceae bacterium]|nr:enolase [Candidatus Humimicrobiaceae bacterium]